MRKLAILLFILILPTVVLADTFEDLKVGDSVEDQHWNISILNMYADKSVLLQVHLDGVNTNTEKVNFNTTTNFDGVNITVTEAFYDADPTLTAITLQNEVLWTNDCHKDEDCIDVDACTLDQCTGYPKRCTWDDSHINITNCISGDDCCPSSCKWNNDKDCPQYPCESDSECNDFNVSTNDTCGADELCEFLEVSWCKTGDAICPDNCTYTHGLIGRDLDCSEDNQCVTHTDCDDKNETTLDICFAEPSTNPKKCTYEEITELPTIEQYRKPTPNAEAKDYEYNDPPEASQSQIDKLLTEGNKGILITIFSVILFALIMYVVWVSLKFKPEPKVYGDT
jgi:hypothetical protein